MQNSIFFFLKQRYDFRVLIKMRFQLIIYGFQHPIFCLFLTFMLKITVLLDKSDIFINHIPHFSDTDLIVS